MRNERPGLILLNVDILTQYTIDLRLIIAAVGFEPIQHICVQMDKVLRLNRQVQTRPLEKIFTQRGNVRDINLVIRHRFEPPPISAGFLVLVPFEFHLTIVVEIFRSSRLCSRIQLVFRYKELPPTPERVLKSIDRAR